MSFYGADLMGPMKKFAQKAATQRKAVKVGYVTSYNADTYTVRVRLEPESTANEKAGITNPVVETNWLPLYRPFGGNGWGILAPPHANPNPPYGDMCVVIWPDNGHGVALTGFFNNQEKPYTGTTPAVSTGSTASKPAEGELVLVHKTGAWIKLLNSGTVQMRSSSGSTLVLDKDGGITASSSTGSSATLDSSGHVTIQDSSGNHVQIGSISASDGIVTKSHLSNVLAEIITVFGRCQAFMTAPPSTAGIIAEASTVVAATS